MIYDDCNQIIVENCADLWIIAKTMNRWWEFPFVERGKQSIDFRMKHKSSIILTRLRLMYMGAILIYSLSFVFIFRFNSNEYTSKCASLPLALILSLTLYRSSCNSSELPSQMLYFVFIPSFTQYVVVDMVEESTAKWIKLVFNHTELRHFKRSSVVVVVVGKEREGDGRREQKPQIADLEIKVVNWKTIFELFQEHKYKFNGVILLCTQQKINHLITIFEFLYSCKL
jgi:hypothetical protein